MKKVKDLKEKEGIVCRSKQEAEQIRQLMHDAGLTWCTERSYIKTATYFDEIVYEPYSGKCLNLNFAKKNNYTIHEAKDFLVEKEDYKNEEPYTTEKLFNLLLSKYNIDLNSSELNEIINITKQQNTITLPLVNGVPDVTNCGVEMLVSDDGENWIKDIVFSFNDKIVYKYSIVRGYGTTRFKHAKPLPKQITKQEAEKLLNNEFEIID